MKKRDVIRTVLSGKEPPYVPWSFGFTCEARQKLTEHFNISDLTAVLHNHIVGVDNYGELFRDIGDDCVQDIFGVVWDKSADKDIGIVKGTVLPEANLSGYQFPDPKDDIFFRNIPSISSRYPDLFLV